MIAHYHWQVGLVADGRLLAAAAAASSDTRAGTRLLCKGLFSPTTTLPTSRHQEDLGSSRTQNDCPCPGPIVGRRPGEEGSQDASPTSSHYSFLCRLLPPSCFPIETGRAWVTCRVLSPPPGPGCGAWGRALSPYSPPPLSQGLQHRSAAVRPSSPLFLKCLQIQKQFRNAFRLREPEDLG